MTKGEEKMGSFRPVRLLPESVLSGGRTTISSLTPPTKVSHQSPELQATRGIQKLRQSPEGHTNQLLGEQQRRIFPGARRVQAPAIGQQSFSETSNGNQLLIRRTNSKITVFTESQVDTCCKIANRKP